MLSCKADIATKIIQQCCNARVVKNKNNNNRELPMVTFYNKKILSKLMQLKKVGYYGNKKKTNPLQSAHIPDDKKSSLDCAGGQR